LGAATVRDVKILIEESEGSFIVVIKFILFLNLIGLQPEQQLLSFGGRDLVDGDALLADYGVASGAIIRISRLWS
jgi:hypothetical protein